MAREKSALSIPQSARPPSLPVYESAQPTPRLLPSLQPVRTILMADPACFDVVYEINAHMTGNIGSVDRTRARAQWEALLRAFEELGLPVAVVPAVEGLPDLVFSANQSFPLRDGSRRVVLSQMALPPRRAEVAHFEAWYRERGFSCIELSKGAVLEGMGDVLWHPGRRLAYAGWGFRTQRASLDLLSASIDAPVMALHLVDDRFYHLDTCLSPLDETCALYVEEAFTAEGLALIRTLFPDAVAIPAEEAVRGFACNGSVVAGHFVVQRGCSTAVKAALSRGLGVVEVETSEFMKSGGSVGCMHLRLGEVI